MIVWNRVVPDGVARQWKDPDLKWCPRSVVIIEGHPKFTIHRSTVGHCFVSNLLIHSAFSHSVKWSIQMGTQTLG